MQAANTFFQQTQQQLQRALLAGVQRAFNHLLSNQNGARQALQCHAGKYVLFQAPPISLALQIEPSGTVQTVPTSSVAPNVTLTFPLAAWPTAAFAALTQETSSALLKHVRIEGDADLAAVMGQLAQHLRWDVEEDLSRWLGDIAAHRVVQMTRGAARRMHDQGRRVLAQMTDYWVYEDRALVARPELDDLTQQVRDVRDAVERLEKRMQRYAARLPVRR